MAVATSGAARRILLVVGVACALGLTGLPAGAGGATHVVTTTADSGPGSLRAAIGGAANGDTITFDASAHGAIVLTTFLEIDKSLTIQGPAPAAAGTAGGAGTCWDTTARPLDASAQPNPMQVMICGKHLNLTADDIVMANLAFEDGAYLSIFADRVRVENNWFDIGSLRNAVEATFGADAAVVTGNQILTASRGIVVNDNAVVRGNKIFTDPSRLAAEGNLIGAVEVLGSGTLVADNEIVTPHRTTGVTVVGSSAHADIHGNAIGLPAVPGDGAIRAGDAIVVKFGATANVGSVPQGDVGALAAQCPPDLSAPGLTAPNTITNVRQSVAVGLFLGGDYTDQASATVCGNTIGGDVPGSPDRVNTGVKAQYGGAVVAGGNTIAYAENSAISGFYSRSLTATDNFLYTNSAGQDLRHADSTGSGIGVTATGPMPPFNNPPSGAVPAQYLVDVQRNHVLALGRGISAGSQNMIGTIADNLVGVSTAPTPPMVQSGISFGGGASTFTVSGNTVVNAELDGIFIGGPVTATVNGNFVGVEKDGTPGPNGQAGIAIGSSEATGFDVTIGGVSVAAFAGAAADPLIPAGSPNVVVNSGSWGIGGYTSATPIVRNNHIGGLPDGTSMPNTRLGIEYFGPDGFVQQDPPADVTRTEVDATTVQVTGTVTDAPDTRVVVELFGNEACHPWGKGEGVIPLAIVDLLTDGTGVADFDVTVANHPVVTATATGTHGTSMFSRCPTVEEDPSGGDTGGGDTGGADAGGGATGGGATGGGGGTSGGTTGGGTGGGTTGGTDNGTTTGTAEEEETGGSEEEPSVSRTGGEGGPVAGATSISQERFPGPGFAQPRRPDWVVLARADVFADAMTGSSLTGDAPLLFTDRVEIPAPTAAEIERLLPDGGTVLLLGGEDAIGEAVQQALVEDGHEVIRLAGETRVETAIAVADFLEDQGSTRQAVADDEMFLARAYGDPDGAEPWADAISGGALAALTARPILLTTSDALPASLEAWLEGRAGLVTVLGGTSAISDEVFEQLVTARRVAGEDRAGTAAMIAVDVWTDAASGGYQLAASNASGAWMLALAAAGLAADEGTPLLLTETDALPGVTADLLACEDDRPPVLRVMGAVDMISQSVVDQITGCE